MSDRMEEIAARISIADISSAIAYGIQRSLERREVADTILDRILRYGGRVEFLIEVAQPGSKGIAQNMQPLQDEGGLGS